MVIRTVLSAALVLGLGAGAAVAQTAPEAVRNPVLGDPGPVHTPRVKQTSRRAHAIARSDKQPPGTTNGNQPDRAAAGAPAAAASPLTAHAARYDLLEKAAA